MPGFFKDGAAWIQWQSRDQKKLRLFESNKQGVLRQILEEIDDAWVEYMTVLDDATAELRESTDWYWPHVRAALVKNGIDPIHTRVAQCFQDDSSMDYMVLATVDSAFDTDIDLDHPSKLRLHRIVAGEPHAWLDHIGRAQAALRAEHFG